jgi:hypothetical protein
VDVGGVADVSEVHVHRSLSVPAYLDPQDGVSMPFRNDVNTVKYTREKSPGILNRFESQPGDCIAFVKGHSGLSHTASVIVRLCLLGLCVGRW